MVETNGPDTATPIEDRDLVVVDRDALRQLLAAVTNTLRASQNLDALELPEETDSAEYEQIRETVANARSALITGVEQIAESVDELPSAIVEPISVDGENGAGDE
jgi:hypothetical protein